MKQTKMFLGAALMLVSAATFTSCEKESATIVQKAQKAIHNPELEAKLKALGFTVENGFVASDDKLENTTTLDLSGAKLTSVEGLEVFPKLEEVNLANNNFGSTFDFAQLPESVTKVNLADNDIYIYKGLATVSNKDGFTLQKELKELILPANARFNVDLLPPYYKETKGKTTLQMQNPQTKAVEPYTTLRTIPDENLREYFKQKFPSIMKGEQIDLLAKFDDVQGSTDIILYDHSQIKNLEGIQYILNNPQYKGSVSIDSSVHLEIPYLKINNNLQVLILHNIDTPYLDFSSAEALKSVELTKNSSIEVLDLSVSKTFMKKKKEEQLNSFGRHSIVLVSCPNLEEIKLPEDITTHYLYEVTLVDLPKLKGFDMSKLEGILHLGLGMLPKAEIVLPKKLSYNIDNDEWFGVSITEDMADNPQVKAFIMEYGEKQILGGKWEDIEDYNSDITPFDYLTEWNIVLE